MIIGIWPWGQIIGSSHVLGDYENIIIIGTQYFLLKPCPMVNASVFDDHDSVNVESSITNLMPIVNSHDSIGPRALRDYAETVDRNYYNNNI